MLKRFGILSLMSCMFLLDAITKVNIFRCPVYHIIGIPCPFCGMTRAVYSVINGDFKASLYYNPGLLLVVLGVIVYLFYGIKDWTIKLFYSILAIMVVIYVVRMFLYFPHHEVVNIKEGSLIAFIINSFFM